MPGKLPLNGCDYLMLAFDREMRRHGYMGNSCQIELELEGRISPDSLRQRVAALSASFPILRARTGGWLLPKWILPGRTSARPQIRLHQERAGLRESLCDEPRAVERGELLRFDLIEGGGPNTTLVFTWAHTLMDANSAEHFIALVGREDLPLPAREPKVSNRLPKKLRDRMKLARKSILQLTTPNHPVDCGICDKAGECLLQDYHYEHQGERSISVDAKVHSTKFHKLSPRITLDNERCVLCSRCVRFTHEVSKTKSLGIVQRGDSSLVRGSEDGAFARDDYSDNVVDLCPVGALLSTAFLYKSRVWYLKKTPSICPGCERGCAVDLWHRKPEWKLHRLEARKNVAIEHVTPRDNPHGPWICNKGRDYASFVERPRAWKATRAS